MSLVTEQFSSHLRIDPLHVQFQRLPTLFGSVADSTESPLNKTEGHVLSLHIYVRKWFAEAPMIVFMSASCI